MRRSRSGTSLFLLAAVLGSAGCGDPAAQPTPAAPAPAPETSILVIDFKDPAAVGWPSVGDSVMGGKSHGAMQSTAEGTAVFGGAISQERGGFVTVRSPSGSHDLRGFTGMEVRVRGDGKAYQLLVKTDAEEGGVQYFYYFLTREGVWQTWRLPFEGFRAHYRALPLAGWARLDPAKVVSMGFLIANWQEGQFRLEIESIKAYR